MPGFEVSMFETRRGPFMSAEDNFEIVFRGVGTDAGSIKGFGLLLESQIIRGCQSWCESVLKVT